VTHPAPLTPDWFTHHRARLDHWRHDQLDLILNDLDEIREEIEELIQARTQTPATITITALSPEGQPMSQFPIGKPIPLKAAFLNAEQVEITITDPVSWTATSGTVTLDDPANTLLAQLTNAAPGTVTVTAADPNGLTGSVTFDVIDATPTTLTVTAG
jgi:hypothetical protein